MKHPPETVYLTLQEAARLLRVNPEVMRRHAKAGRVPCAAKFGRLWRFPERDLRAWIEAGGTVAAGDRP